MKKLLTVVVLALLLCLAVSFALATTYSGSLTGYELTNLLSDSTSVYQLAGSESIKDVSLVEPTIAELQEAGHEKYVNAKVSGLSAETGKYITTEIRVRWSTHSWKVVEAETNNCEEGGKKVYKCTICGETKEEAFPATSHTFVEVNTATCTDKGKLYDKCSVCGYYAKDKLGNPVYKKDATGKVIETPALGHKAKANSWATDVKCNPDTQRLTDGYIYQVCERCGKSIDNAEKIEVKGGTDLEKQAKIAAKIDKWSLLNAHTFEKEPYKTFGPTCTLKGGASYWCTVCGFMYDKFDDKQPALGHLWGVDEFTTCKDATVTWICKRCDEKAVPTATSVADKLDKNGNVIGKTYKATIEGKEYTFDLLHDFSIVEETYYIDEAKGYYFETVPGASYAKDVLESFCANANKYTYMKCSVCGIHRTIKTPVGHTWGAWELVADKEELGTKTSRFQRVCTVCGKLQVKVSAGVPCGDGEHNYVPVDKTKLVCGSLNAGTKLICTECGAETTGEWFIADHDYELVVVVKAATCTEKGSKIVKCANCGDIKEVEVEPIAHLLKKVEKVPATCAKTGTEEYYKCELCGKLFSDKDAKTEIKAAAKIAVDPEAHEWDEGKVTTEPTTEKAGEKTYTCKLCGKTKTEEVAKLIPDAEYKIVDAKFDGELLTGKIVHTDGTKVADKLNIRVTFFTAGNNYMVTAATIYEDGTFEAQGAGKVEAITLAAYATNKVVNPSDVAGLTKLDAVEIEVK